MLNRAVFWTKLRVKPWRRHVILMLDAATQGSAITQSYPTTHR